MQNPVNHLKWSFFSTLVNGFQHLRCLAGFWIPLHYVFHTKRIKWFYLLRYIAFVLCLLFDTLFTLFSRTGVSFRSWSRLYHLYHLDCIICIIWYTVLIISDVLILFTNEIFLFSPLNPWSEFVHNYENNSISSPANFRCHGSFRKRIRKLGTRQQIP